MKTILPRNKNYVIYVREYVALYKKTKLTKSLNCHTQTNPFCLNVDSYTYIHRNEYQKPTGFKSQT